jgi:hypothetical protein
MRVVSHDVHNDLSHLRVHFSGPTHLPATSYAGEELYTQRTRGRFVTVTPALAGRSVHRHLHDRGIIRDAVYGRLCLDFASYS